MGAQAKGIRYFPKRWQNDSALEVSANLLFTLAENGNRQQKQTIRHKLSGQLLPAMDLTAISKIPIWMIKNEWTGQKSDTVEARSATQYMKHIIEKGNLEKGKERLH